MSNKIKRAARAGKPLYVAIATALFCTSAGIAAAPVESGDHFLIVPAGSYDRLEAGRQLVHDYGPFQLWRMDGGHAAEIRSAAGKDVQPVDTAILFEAGAFDPPNQRFARPALSGFDPSKPSGISIELVQFVGPIADAWEKQLSATGVTVLQYIPNNAYAVLADAQGRAALSEFQRSNATVRLAETLQPIYKLNGALAQRARAGLSPSGEIDVSIVLARHDGNAASKAAIRALQRGSSHSEWASYTAFETMSLRVRESDIETLAALSDVFALEDYHHPVLMDESQNQIIAGNFNPTFTAPSGPGYLAWLTAQGFSTNPADYPIVAVVDDGVGNGTTTLGAGDITLTQNSANAVSRVMFATNCTTDPLADGLAGHGHINASIIGGFDNRGDAAGIQFPFEDPNGFLRGQGLNPWARVGNTKFFNNGGSGQLTNCGGSFVGQIRSQHAAGARISSNSWGAAVNGDYTANSATFDAATRDADTTLAGLQPMIFLIAAGNQGSGASTIGSPATGKNVITVGASENVRPDYTDACDGAGPPPPPTTRADNAMDVIDFSSRGPAEGARIKPELIAPGTHIQGTASTAAGYDGTGVCAQFVPAGQTHFASSSGTSHSTPALAGVTSLVYRYLQTTYGITPSGAMAKAYLMAHPTYLTGVAGNGNLPTNAQGFGMPNLGRAFDATTERALRDEQDVLGATGSTSTFSYTVDDPGKPLRIALAWSDAPGATSADPKVNNLNLEVDVGGNTYRGNVFTGQASTTGGTADANNNYEAVFLPAGTTGPIQIRVIGANIAGDGVPGNADTTDQDFALVCSNCLQPPDFVVSASAIDAATCGVDTASWSVAVNPLGGYAGSVNLSAVPPGGTPTFAPASGAVPLASNFTLNTTGIASGLYSFPVNATDGAITRSTNVSLQHDASAPAGTTLTAPADGSTGHLGAPTLQWTALPGVSSYVVEVDNDAGFSSIDYTATVGGTSHTPAFTPASLTQYFWRVRGINNCGPGTNSGVFSFTTAEAYCANPILAIPDDNAAGVTSNIVVPSGAALTDLNVVFQARHTWIGDLSATLSRNGGTARILIDRPGFTGSGFGCSGQNPDIVLDDEGTSAVETTCTNTNPGYPAGASRTPNETLSIFDGQGLATTWTLTVRDNAGGDTGFLDRWCLVPTLPAAPVDAVNDSFAVTEDLQLNQAAPGVLGNDTPGGLTATLITPPVNGNLTLNGNGSFAYLPLSNACGGAGETFTYQASNGVTNDNATVTLNIACVNDAPVAVNDAYNGTEDTPLVVAQAQGVLTNDTDVESNPLTAVSASDPANGSVVLNANGGFTYTPDANYCSVATPDTFTYSANDGTATSAAPATVSVTVACVNDGAPVAVVDAGTVAEGGTLTVNAANGVLSNDTDVDGDTLTAVLDTTTTNGTLTLNPNGNYSYVHNGSETTSDSFTYHANDGVANSNVVTVAITVMPVNDNAPVAVADVGTVAEGGTLTVNAAAGVLSNDTDVDGSTLTAVLDATTTHGTLTLNPNGSYSYVHNGGETTSDSFTYHANDGVTDSNVVTVAITVTPVNDAPVAVADTGTVAEGGTLNVPATGVLGNDTDADGSALTAVLNATTTNGTLTLNANGSYSYVHNGGETTSDSFTYHANDGVADSNVVTVAITVTPVNDAPTVATPIADRTDAEGAAINTSIAGNFADADAGQTLTFSADGLPTGLSMNVAGLITGTIALTANANSPYTVMVTANDGNGGTIPDTFIWTVTNTNQAPVVNDQGFAVTVGSANGTAIGTIVSTDPDAGDTRTVTVTGGTGQALFAVNAATGAITVANSAGLVAGASLTLNVTVTDVGGLSDTAVITISVQGSRIFFNGYEGS